MLTSIRSRLRAAVAAGFTALIALSLIPPTQTIAALPVASGDPPTPAIRTVKRWLEYLEEGRSRRAWRLIAKPSRRNIGGFVEFKAQSSAWAEGWGAWAKAKKRDFELRVIAPMDENADSVVTMRGRVALEGPYRRRAAALPVQTRDGVTKVDPVRGKAVIRRIHPSNGGVVGRRPRFKAIVRHIRARNNSVYFMVKGSKVDPTRARLHKIGRRAYRATVNWSRRVSPGRHVLTVASWGRAGFKAAAAHFRVRG
jgi:hypothetical protein